MDRLTKAKRSWNMSRIRGKNTAPELTVRSFLHRNGIRFRIHAVNLIGKPDIVLPKYKTVVFVHGCFWHRHKNCKYAYEPKSRIAFWRHKFSDNVRRFSQVKTELEKKGWKTLVIWECEVGDTKKLSKILNSLVRGKAN